MLTCILSFLLASCATTYPKDSRINGLVIPDTEYLNARDKSVIVGAQKKNGTGSVIGVAQLVITNERGRSTPVFSQLLNSGDNNISLFIANNYQFVTAKTKLKIIKGKQYFVNFSINESSQALKIKRVWISDEKGRRIKELKTWSKERGFNQAFGSNVS